MAAKTASIFKLPLSVKIKFEKKKMSKERFEFINYSSSIYSKIILFALNMSGITICKNNIFKRVAGTIFHVLVILSAARSFACIFYGADLQDYYVGILLSAIFTIILWWSLFFSE